MLTRLSPDDVTEFLHKRRIFFHGSDKPPGRIDLAFRDAKGNTVLYTRLTANDISGSRGSYTVSSHVTMWLIGVGDAPRWLGNHQRWDALRVKEDFRNCYGFDFHGTSSAYSELQVGDAKDGRFPHLPAHHWAMSLVLTYPGSGRVRKNIVAAPTMTMAPLLERVAELVIEAVEDEELERAALEVKQEGDRVVDLVREHLTKLARVESGYAEALTAARLARDAAFEKLKAAFDVDGELADCSPDVREYVRGKIASATVKCALILMD